MALRAGRVGVRPDQVDAQGRIIGGGGGGSVDYTLSQGETTSTNSATASLTNGKYYLFQTVYDGDTFTNARIAVGNTDPVYTAGGIGQAACIIQAKSDTVTYSRSGDLSPNEYTELDITDDCGIGPLDSAWSSGTTASVVNGKIYFVVLGDGESGSIIGADVLAEHKLVDTISNGSRALIVKATSDSISLSSEHTFYYMPIGILV